MDIAKQLAKAHSRANADLILEWLLKEKARTQVLMDVVRSREVEFKIVQRAAMVLGDLGRLRPAWLLGYHSELLDLVHAYDHPALPRAITRYFSELSLDQISEDNQGRLLEMSFVYVGNPQATVTVRVFSMATLLTFTKRYPELRDEVRGMVEEVLLEEGATAGLLAGGRRVLGGVG